MSYIDYAKNKYDKFKGQGWEVSELFADENSTFFYTRDAGGMVRRHYFSTTAIVTETGNYDFSTKQPEPTPEVIEAVPEVIPEPVKEVVESVIYPGGGEVVTPSKKKKKGQ